MEKKEVSLSQQSRMNNLSDIYARFLLLGITVEKADMHEKWKKFPKATRIWKNCSMRERESCVNCACICVCVCLQVRERVVFPSALCVGVWMCVNVWEKGEKISKMVTLNERWCPVVCHPILAFEWSTKKRYGLVSALCFILWRSHGISIFIKGLNYSSKRVLFYWSSLTEKSLNCQHLAKKQRT